MYGGSSVKILKYRCEYDNKFVMAFQRDNCLLLCHISASTAITGFGRLSLLSTAEEKNMQHCFLSRGDETNAGPYLSSLADPCQPVGLIHLQSQSQN